MRDQTFWAYNYCPTSYSWLVLLGLVLYLAAFAPGSWRPISKKSPCFYFLNLSDSQVTCGHLKQQDHLPVLCLSGMGPMPWTINSEIYPLWARSTGNACAAGVNWTFNILVSLTFLHLAQYFTYYGQSLSKAVSLICSLTSPPAMRQPQQHPKGLSSHFYSDLCRRLMIDRSGRVAGASWDDYITPPILFLTGDDGVGGSLLVFPPEIPEDRKSPKSRDC